MHVVEIFFPFLIQENDTEKNDIDNADDVENSEIAAYIKVLVMFKSLYVMINY